ncbi:bifunctional metallophosphatase/5'-nucleotidase [Oceanobacter mangrovi]|uniref:bifunctional metallophosphatase/5'-nucleotidase n=1 Tax=Oceanobacter mangrovi TaxID=2862510 RepID=UPI001C8E978D|nr:bifunctional metallophosphatase/5'-nucleotidase [Oceanobacter mangrovi]
MPNHSIARLPGLSLLLSALLAALLPACSSLPGQPEQTITVNIAAINDLHGHLEPARLPFSYSTANGKALQQAGGLKALTNTVEALRQQDPDTLFIGAGDLIGASPVISSLWADEPTLLALNRMKLDMAAVGNHELDNGKDEFLRLVNGGCHSRRPDQACQYRDNWSGVNFPYLAANLIDSSSGKPLTAAYVIKQVKGLKIALIGAVLQDLPSVVSARSLQGIQALDEAQTINRQVPELLAQGVDAIIVVIHQGGQTAEAFNSPGCSQLRGDILPIVDKLDKHIKVVITGHTHQGYLCKRGDVTITQALAYGQVVTHLQLQINPRRHQVTDVKAANLVVDPTAPTQPANRLSSEMEILLDDLKQRGNARINQPIARLAVAEMNKQANPHGESVLGDLIADAQLAATRSFGAVAALTNYGGIRDSLRLSRKQQQVNYGQLAAIQPFNNELVVVTLNGSQIDTLLESQWRGDSDEFRPLQVSAGFSYQWQAAAPQGQKVDINSIRINGKAIKPEHLYKITVNEYMAGGGSHLTVLTQASQQQPTGLRDLPALIDYIKARDQAGSPAGFANYQGRIERLP